jgi:hypothetical protein
MNLLPFQTEFAIERAQYLALVGVIGSGKTTAGLARAVHLSHPWVGDGLCLFSSRDIAARQMKRLEEMLIERYQENIEIRWKQDGTLVEVILTPEKNISWVGNICAAVPPDDTPLYGRKYGWCWIDDPQPGAFTPEYWQLLERAVSHTPEAFFITAPQEKLCWITSLSRHYKVLYAMPWLGEPMKELVKAVETFRIAVIKSAKETFQEALQLMAIDAGFIDPKEKEEDGPEIQRRK